MGWGCAETEEQKCMGDVLKFRKDYNPERENRLKKKEKNDPLIIRILKEDVFLRNTAE